MATPTTEELVCFAFVEERVCNSCAVCISPTFSLSQVVPYEILCEMLIEQMLQTFTLLSAEYTNSVLWSSHFQN